MIIPDNQMTASSYYSSDYLPQYGRLDDTRGYGWSALEPDGLYDWLQVDFGEIVEVCAVATQGEVDNFDWAIDFYLSFSSDGATWTNFTDGNASPLVGFFGKIAFISFVGLNESMSLYDVFVLICLGEKICVGVLVIER